MNPKLFLCFCGLFIPKNIPKESIYNYGSLARRNFKKRYHLTGLVEDHHIIPKQWRNHKIIKESGYNISESYNIIFMPSHRGIAALNTKRLLHSGGHDEYNKYVKKSLDTFDFTEELVEFVAHLKKNLRNGNQDQIPWK